MKLWITYIILLTSFSLSAQLAQKTNFWGTKYFENGKKISKSQLHDLVLSQGVDKIDFKNYNNFRKRVNLFTVLGGALLGVAIWQPTLQKSLPYYGGSILFGIFSSSAEAKRNKHMQRIIDSHNKKIGSTSYQLDIQLGRIVLSW